ATPSRPNRLLQCSLMFASHTRSSPRYRGLPLAVADYIGQPLCGHSAQSGRYQRPHGSSRAPRRGFDQHRASITNLLPDVFPPVQIDQPAGTALPSNIESVCLRSTGFSQTPEVHPVEIVAAITDGGTATQWVNPLLAVMEY